MQKWAKNSNFLDRNIKSTKKIYLFTISLHHLQAYKNQLDHLLK